MLLQSKNAIIYGAGGSLGGEVAKALARAGARVFLTGRKLPPVQKLADEIRAFGGDATVDQVDGMDKKAVTEHIEKVIKTAGSLDISFNAIGVDLIQGIPLTDLSTEDFIQPITYTMTTRFITATAAGRTMMAQRSGVILSLTATPGGISYPYTAGFAPACAAVETLSQNLAGELGKYGIRVVNIRSGGSPDSRVFKQAIDANPEAMGPILRSMEKDTMLKKLPMMADIANAAVFLSSDLAGKITGVTLDVTAGTTAGLNYRVSPL